MTQVQVVEVELFICDLPLLDQVSGGFRVLQGYFSKGTDLKNTYPLLHLPAFDTISQAPTWG